jgi:hypothetical protein
MFTEGTTFFMSPDPHLWAIISDPVKNPDEIVQVNFTTITTITVTAGPSDDPSNDRSCVVQAGEHEFITHLRHTSTITACKPRHLPFLSIDIKPDG